MVSTDFASWTPFNANPHDFAVVSSAFLFTLALYTLYQTCRPTPSKAPIPSPLKTVIPSLTASQMGQLPYPPDAFPGARDVVSPYGTLRVYEWGSEDKDARKVVLVHGISTPCFTLGAVAHGLADKSCRVILLDLWGRGYSEAPVDVPHNTGLYASAILIAITSSPLPWTRFTLIGYSFGGGISASFASYFPHLVSNLVLLAPSGLIRDYHFSKVNRMLYTEGVLPEALLEWLVARRLGNGPLKSEAVKDKGIDASLEAAAVDGEIPEKVTVELSRSRPGLDVSKSVAWQVKKHRAFTKAFISSIRYGPIGNQHEDWRRIGEQMSEDKVTGKASTHKKILIVLGKTDSIIIHDELIEDATALLGKDNVVIRSCDVGHDVPMEKSKDIVEYIHKLWED